MSGDGISPEQFSSGPPTQIRTDIAKTFLLPFQGKDIPFNIMRHEFVGNKSDIAGLLRTISTDGEIVHREDVAFNTISDLPQKLNGPPLARRYELYESGMIVPKGRYLDLVFKGSDDTMYTVRALIGEAQNSQVKSSGDNSTLPLETVEVRMIPRYSEQAQLPYSLKSIVLDPSNPDHKSHIDTLKTVSSFWANSEVTALSNLAQNCKEEEKAGINRTLEIAKMMRMDLAAVLDGNVYFKDDHPDVMGELDDGKPLSAILREPGEVVVDTRKTTKPYVAKAADGTVLRQYNETVHEYIAGKDFVVVEQQIDVGGPVTSEQIGFVNIDAMKQKGFASSDESNEFHVHKRGSKNEARTFHIAVPAPNNGVFLIEAAYNPGQSGKALEIERGRVSFVSPEVKQKNPPFGAYAERVQIDPKNTDHSHYIEEAIAAVGGWAEHKKMTMNEMATRAEQVDMRALQTGFKLVDELQQDATLLLQQRQWLWPEADIQHGMYGVYGPLRGRG